MSILSSPCFFSLLLWPKSHCNCSDRWGNAMPGLGFLHKRKWLVQQDDWCWQWDAFTYNPVIILPTRNSRKTRNLKTQSLYSISDSVREQRVGQSLMRLVNSWGWYWSTRSVIPTVSTVGTPGWSHQGMLPGSRKVGLLSWIWNEKPDLSFMLPPHIRYIIHSKCNHFGASMGPWRHSRVFPLSFLASLEGVRPKSSDFCWESHHPSPSHPQQPFLNPPQKAMAADGPSDPIPYSLWLRNKHWMVWGQGVLNPSPSPTTILL